MELTLPKKPFQLKISYVLLPLLLAIVVYILYLANYLGAFKSVLIKEITAGPFHLVYKTHVGPYHKVNEALQEVESWARNNGLSCRLSFGEYLDNPETTEENRLRANVGCIVDSPLAQIPENFLQSTRPQSNYVVAQFDGASSIGPMKVYPRVKEYFAMKNYQFPESVLEIYEIHSNTSMTTKYYFFK